MKSPFIQLDIDGCLEILIVYKTAKFQSLQSRTLFRRILYILSKKKKKTLDSFLHEYFHEVIFLNYNFNYFPHSII